MQHHSTTNTATNTDNVAIFQVKLAQPFHLQKSSSICSRKEPFVLMKKKSKAAVNDAAAAALGASKHKTDAKPNTQRGQDGLLKLQAALLTGSVCRPAVILIKKPTVTQNSPVLTAPILLYQLALMRSSSGLIYLDGLKLLQRTIDVSHGHRRCQTELSKLFNNHRRVRLWQTNTTCTHSTKHIPWIQIHWNHKNFRSNGQVCLVLM